MNRSTFFTADLYCRSPRGKHGAVNRAAINVIAGNLSRRLTYLEANLRVVRQTTFASQRVFTSILISRLQNPPTAQVPFSSYRERVDFAFTHELLDGPKSKFRFPTSAQTPCHNSFHFN